MPTRTAIRTLLSEIERVDTEIDRCKRALAAGTGRARVRAAGELAELEPRASQLRRRLAALRSSNGMVAESFRVGLDVELRQLAEAFERWIEP